MPSITQQDYIRLEIKGLAYDEWEGEGIEKYSDRLIECMKNGTLMDVVFFNKNDDGTTYTDPWESRVLSWHSDGTDLYIYCDSGDAAKRELHISLTD